jgi:hypothetical protein
MILNTKMFPGALVVAGLLAACGGEVQNEGNVLDDTSRLENRLTVLTGSGETVSCEDGTLQVYEPRFGCRLSANFIHQYRTGETVVFGPPGFQWVEKNGYVQNGHLAFTQSLNVGPRNGYVAFLGGTSLGISSMTRSPSDGYANTGTLAQDTCLTGMNGSKSACKGGTWASFDITTGNLTSCTSTTNISCN